MRFGAAAMFTSALFTIEQCPSGVLQYRRQMSVPLVPSVEEAHAKRWREWQVKNEYDRRQGSRRAQMVFTLIFIAVGLWLVLQLVS